MIESNKQQFLHPGDLYFSQEPVLFKTVLGSCVALCLFDGRLKRGGMNHYVFPQTEEGSRDRHFGSVSIPCLINAFLKSGSRLSDIQISLFGGASSHNVPYERSAGRKNVLVAEHFLQDWNLSLFRKEVGGCHGKKVLFDTDHNSIEVIPLLDCMQECKRKASGCKQRVVSPSAGTSPFAAYTPR